jgi:DNA polymerase III gamma/tau subunit
MGDLHTRFRPATWNEVIGHQATVRSIQEALKKKLGRAFLLTGPAGVGKTTIARLIAAEVGCLPVDFREVDAATNNGIDSMRAVTEVLQYSSLSGSPVKVLLLDEAHALSKAAWQSLLKVVEEPPPHAYWIFCTTEGHKVPETIRSRCLCYDLPSLRPDDLYDLIDRVTSDLKVKVEDRVASSIVRAARGSPRRVLTALAQCLGCKTSEEALEVLQEADLEEGSAVDLARALVQGTTWEKVMSVVKSMEETNPESIRLVILNYLGKVLLSAKGDKKATALLSILDAFSSPYIQAEGLAPLLLSLGRVLYA